MSAIFIALSPLILIIPIPEFPIPVAMAAIVSFIFVSPFIVVYSFEKIL